MYLRKVIIFVSILFALSPSLQAQHADDTIKLNNINYNFLEYLVKKQVDSIREANGLLPLYNDIILYLASRNHVEYLSAEGITDHYQRQNKKYYSPQTRVETFGGIDYKVGENIGTIHLHTSTYYSHIGEGSEHIVYTYRQAAKDFIISWLNNPENMGYITSRRYQATAVAIKLEEHSNVLRAVHKFAIVPDNYVPINGNKVFYYAVDDFSDIVSKYKHENKLVSHKKHAWKLTWALTPELITMTNKKLSSLAKLKQSTSRHKVNLYFSSQKTLKSIITAKKDGFMVEAVPFEHYKPGSELYYSYPSRRNGNCIYNGIVNEPLWYESFFPDDENTGTERGGVDLALGQVPEKMKDKEYEANALLLKNGSITKVIVPTSYCTDLMTYYPDSIPYVDDWTNHQYISQIESDTFSLKIFFKSGEVTGKYEDVNPYIEYLKKKNYIIAKAEIEAYASVDGDPEINKNLFTVRANRFVEEIKEKQDAEIVTILMTKENWEMFFEQIKGTEFASLAKMDTTELRAYINNPENKQKLTKFLDKQRFANVNLIAIPNISDETRIKFARKEYRMIFEELNTLGETNNTNERHKTRLIKQLESIQLFMYGQLFKGKLTYQLVTKLKIPEGDEYIRMAYNRLLLRYKADIGSARLTESELFNESIRFRGAENMSPSYYYNIMVPVAKFPSELLYSEDITLKNMKKLIPIIDKSDIDNSLVDKIKLYYHFQNSDNYYKESNFKRAKNSLRFIAYYYKKYAKDTLTLKYTAEHLLEFQQEKLAFSLIEPFVLCENPNHDLLSFYLKLQYYDYGEVHEFDYYQSLFNATEILTNKEWCNLFVGECNIGFQIFDYEPLWKTWCIKCNQYQ